MSNQVVSGELGESIVKFAFIFDLTIPIRTDWAGRSMAFTERHPEYDHLDAKGMMMARHGTQPGDPRKAAKAFYDLAMMEDPPLRILLGTDAYPAILARLEEEKRNFMKYEGISLGTDVD